MTKTINVPLSYDQLSDLIYYLEWKISEINEAGCDLEFPEIENTLQQLQETQDRLRVRTEEEYYGPLGHINGSILIPINELENRLDELIDYKENTIYVVCRSGNRSGFGKDILNENNFTAVNVDGGMLDWKADNNER